ncbi:MAG TPA: pyridoxamine 5'-phosphate oxidase family protein [Myxococcaceae bacterium]|nr:pyridoxamine 5'-phosphate oxidase family protein [Myxococcaceae bacterium]
MDERMKDIEQVGDLIRGIRVAMLTTVDGDGELHSRPMATQDVDFDGTLWFFTAADSEKAAELEREARVNVSYADVDRSRYVSLSGSARLVRDRERIRELWKPFLKAWFPKGLDDPELALLEVAVTAGEYWDAPASRLVRLAGLVKGALTGTGMPGGEHGHLDVHH